MPEVKTGESRKDYLGRCIPMVMSEGLNRNQAVGKCEGMYNSHVKKSITLQIGKAVVIAKAISKKDRDMVGVSYDMMKAIKAAESIASPVNKARTVEGYESPEPGDIPEHEKKILAAAYASARKQGYDKERSAKIAWAAVKNARETKKAANAAKSLRR